MLSIMQIFGTVTNCVKDENMLAPVEEFVNGLSNPQPASKHFTC